MCVGRRGVYWSFGLHSISKSDQVSPLFCRLLANRSIANTTGKRGDLQLRQSLKGDIQVDNVAPRAKRMKQQKAQYSAARPLLPVREQDDTLVFLEKRANMA